MKAPTPAGTAVIVGASGGLGRALLQQVAASGRYSRILALARRTPDLFGAEFVPCDLEDEPSIEAAAARTADGPAPTLVFVATGVLHGPGLAPERSLKALNREAMIRALSLNAVGPALLAKHFVPLLPRAGRSVFAALSARVGSIGDNRLGGWHSYRASKAALNMVLRTVAVELARTHPEAVCAALHPGTVATELSAPFQRGVPPETLFAPAVSAERLLAVLDGLGPERSGGFFAWDGSPIPW